MKISHRAVAVGLVLSLVGEYFLHLPNLLIGFTYKQTNDEIEVSAGSHPAAILWAVLVIFVYILILKQRVPSESTGEASLIRRFLAFLIDFSVVLIATSSIDTIIPLAVEARRIGHFEWSFQRDYSVSSDSIFFPLVLLSFVEMFFYYLYPLTKSKQTIGDYVMRLKVAPPFGDNGRFTWGAAMKRISYSFAGLCLWPFTLLQKLDRNGQTWYDRATNCNVSLVKYKRDSLNTSE